MTLVGGAAVGLLAERYAVGRRLRSGVGPSEAPLGSLRGTPVPCIARDGTRLSVEVDPAGRSANWPGITAVFSHGYCNSSDAYHFQRRDLRGRVRMVYWDQRGHGRSERGEDGSLTIETLGEDLHQVLNAAAPEGPLLLVGHSMGGMAIMALAAAHPEIFAERVLGVALLATSSGGEQVSLLGLPAVVGGVVQNLSGRALATLARTSAVVDATRRAGSDLGLLLTRRYGFGSAVPAELVEFTAEMVDETSIGVVSGLFPALGRHDKRAALAALHGVETVVICGESDAITPIEASRAIVMALPEAEFITLPKTGHMLTLERPLEVTTAIEDLLDRIARAHPEVGRTGEPPTVSQ